MANSASGKWVSRVGAAGGGKAYRQSRPVNYYGVLSVIVVLGLLTVWFSRYEYQNPGGAKTPPAIGTTWYAAFGGEACGKQLSTLIPDSTTWKGGLKVMPNNVIEVSPLVSSEAGSNATVAKFLSEYAGLVFNGTKFAMPTLYGMSDPKQTYVNGQKCPAGSKYAGQKGRVVIAYWPSLSQKNPILTTDPASIRFTQLMRLTFAFEPANVTPKQPSVTALTAMINAANGSSTSTTVITGTTSTTLATTTTMPVTTTTTHVTTTTAHP